jgi:hypothetical protein
MEINARIEHPLVVATLGMPLHMNQLLVRQFSNIRIERSDLTLFIR